MPVSRRWCRNEAVRRLAACLALLAALPADANHPLITEDTGVLGKGGWQLELHGEKARDRQGGIIQRTTEVSAVLGYGVIEKADLQIELPYLREVTDGDVAKGRGDASLSLKWRFYESAGFSMVFKPDVLLPSGRDELGLGAGRTRWAANLAAAYEFGKFELLGHVGYTHNRNRIAERQSLWHASAALLYALTDKLRVLVDYGRDSHPDSAARTPRRELVYGLTYALSEDLDLGIGVKKGLNDPADDRALRLGAKLRW
jgi:predicted porin